MVSIVITIYKSREILSTLLQRLFKVVRGFEHELILIDNGNTDDTLQALKKIALAYPQLKVISLSRNFGQQAAISAGLQYSKGDCVIIMDDDLQDPPELIPELLEKWREGYEVVYAIRNRKEGWVKKKLYTLFYKLFNRISYINIPPDSGDFGLMDRKVVDAINSMPEQSRFLRGMRAWAGFKQTGIYYDRPPRFKGKSTYTPVKVLQFVMYGLLAFSNMPLYLSFIAGLTALLYGKFFDAMELFSIGILGKYIVRINDEVNRRPLYLIREKINL
jgi:dolichol-phosphate mannosyltransferase